jgi:hypothetical protein
VTGKTPLGQVREEVGLGNQARDTDDLEAGQALQGVSLASSSTGMLWRRPPNKRRPAMNSGAACSAIKDECRS